MGQPRLYAAMIHERCASVKIKNSLYTGALRTSLREKYEAKYYLPSKSLLTLYYALIYPYFTYCNLIWASTCVTSLQRIYLIQNRAVWAISKTDYKASSKPLLTNLKKLLMFLVSTRSKLVLSCTYIIMTLHLSLLLNLSN